MKEALKYQIARGREPFSEWFSSLDWVSQAKIDAYIVCASLGSASKNIRPLGDGVYEIKIDYGPGYRVYFGTVASGALLLLFGGDMTTQRRDIRKAKDYWRVYLEKNAKL